MRATTGSTCGPVHSLSRCADHWYQHEISSLSVRAGHHPCASSCSGASRVPARSVVCRSARSLVSMNDPVHKHIKDPHSRLELRRWLTGPFEQGCVGLVGVRTNMSHMVLWLSSLPFQGRSRSTRRRGCSRSCSLDRVRATELWS